MNYLFQYLEKQIFDEYLGLYQAWVKERRSLVSLEMFLYYESGSGDYPELKDFFNSLLVKALGRAWTLYDNEAVMVEK